VVDGEEADGGDLDGAEDEVDAGLEDAGDGEDEGHGIDVATAGGAACREGGVAVQIEEETDVGSSAET
jgi:hypothetical protein